MGITKGTNTQNCSQHVRADFLLELNFTFHLRCIFIRCWPIHQRLTVQQAVLFGIRHSGCTGREGILLFRQSKASFTRTYVCGSVALCVRWNWICWMWDVCLHNSVYHSHLNEERRKWVHKDCGNLKIWIPFHGCLDVPQMCWKGMEIQITAHFHCQPALSVSWALTALKTHSKMRQMPGTL